MRLQVSTVPGVELRAEGLVRCHTAADPTYDPNGTAHLDHLRVMQGSRRTTAACTSDEVRA
jgi:hypothetical protein